MKKITALLLALMLLGSSVCHADNISDSRTVIGADLDGNEIASVYKSFGIERGDVKELTVTNADERKYLEGQVDESLIGTRSISCIYIEAAGSGEGLDVSVDNITWCTADMYMNAMVTAGITDADVKIVAPYKVSGTAALTGIYMAYEDITGKKLDEDAKLIGTKELTITAELADEIGSADSTAIVNELKLILDQTKDMTDDELREQIKQIAEKYEVTLNDSQIDQLISLCRSLEKLDVSALKEKVEQVQQYIKNIADAKGSVENFLSQAADTVTEFVNKVIDFFKNLFG
ncbi:MAG TPA: hypothetical protein DIT84_01525 [Clostridiales bacterium]|nr:hypothetical protein [Clostridiales bacterium]